MNPYPFTEPLSLALSKGRIANQVIDALSRSGYTFEQGEKRCLTLEDKSKKLRIFLVKAKDVPAYIFEGIADIGLVGKDIIDESPSQIYELMDLGIGQCNLCLASFQDFDYKNIPFLKIASKYPVQTKKFLAANRLSGQVVPLNGSVELGPITGISNCIIDIVETGRTLKENGLVVIKNIKPISTRLIANKIHYKTKTESIWSFMKTLEKTFDKNRGENHDYKNHKPQFSFPISTTV